MKFIRVLGSSLVYAGAKETSSYYYYAVSFPLLGLQISAQVHYSNSLVYNNFPWPVQATDTQRARVEEQAQAVLDARARYPDSTLGDLYDPLLMPADLLRAHGRLDRAVERCYRREAFASDQARVEFLFAAYEQMAAPLLPAAKKRSGRNRSV